MAKRTPHMLAARLASGSPVTFPQLQAALGNASHATTFRYLRQVPHLRSYNHNGCYYTHRDPPRFDRHGLLSLGDVHLSRHGSLAATARRLLGEPAAGRTQKELEALLHVRVQAFLLAAIRRRKLRRRRMAGVWVYLYPDPAVGDAQRRASRSRLDRLARRRGRRRAGSDPRHRGATGADVPLSFPGGGGQAAAGGHWTQAQRWLPRLSDDRSEAVVLA